MIRVPLLDLPALHAPLAGEIQKALARVAGSGHYILGPEVERFEAELAATSGLPHAVGCASGSDAVWLALAELGIGPGDQVVCPAFTFLATATAIQRLGATPVFADIDPSTYCTSARTLEDAARGCDRLAALVPVDLFGRCADLAATEALSRSLGVPFVEDAAQAIGARDTAGLPMGARAQVATLSFYPTKNLAALGDGGALLCRDAERADRLRELRSHGTIEVHGAPRIGVNSRLDALQAAVLSVKLGHLETWTKAREENAALLDRRFLAAGARRAGEPGGDAGLPLWIPAAASPPERPVHHHYVLRVPAALRDPLRAHLENRGVASAIYYPVGLHRHPGLLEPGQAPPSLPQTEAAGRETLVVPVHPALTGPQRDAVVESVLSFFQEGAPS